MRILLCCMWFGSLVFATPAWADEPTPPPLVPGVNVAPHGAMLISPVCIFTDPSTNPDCMHYDWTDHLWHWN